MYIFPCYFVYPMLCVIGLSLLHYEVTFTRQKITENNENLKSTELCRVNEHYGRSFTWFSQKISCLSLVTQSTHILFTTLIVLWCYTSWHNKITSIANTGCLLILKFNLQMLQGPACYRIFVIDMCSCEVRGYHMITIHTIDKIEYVIAHCVQLIKICRN